MPKLTLEPKITPLIKLILLGNSGSGKSTALVALGVKDIVKGFPGYELRWLDHDGKAEEIIRSQLYRLVKASVITRAQAEYALTNNYDVCVCREKTGIVGAGFGGDQKIGVVGTPVAWTNGIKQIKKWHSTFSPETILIDDSLTYAAHAAVNFCQNANGQLNEPLSWRDYSCPQQLINRLMTLMADVPCPAILTGHYDAIEVTKRTGKKDNKGNEIEELLDVVVAPIAVGKSGRIQLPAQLNHLLVCATSGEGESAQRLIHTAPTKGIETKTPFFAAKKTYPITKGLAEYFMLGQ